MGERTAEPFVEQVTPARHQMREQRVFVLQQKIMAGVELVCLCQSEVCPQQIGHGTLAEPIAVQLPLAARRDQVPGLDPGIRDQHLQDLILLRALTARRQAIGPEAVQPQRLPQLPSQPTGAPLARPA